MKLIIAIAGCLLFSTFSFGQNSSGSDGGKKVRKSAIGGSIRDARRHPIARVQAYIYRNDTIVASGFSSADGSYETNNVMPGVYSLRLVYPSSKRLTVERVPVKMLKVTNITIVGNPPVEDSTIIYSDLVPQEAPKRW